MKRCRCCHERKSLDEFSPDSRGVLGRHAYCKRCNADRAKLRRLDNPERARRNDRAANLGRYGISPDRYDALLAEQGGRCAACGSSDPGGPTGRFQVDHDHSCCPGKRSCGACIRGLLCQPCNGSLGVAKDDLDRLVALSAYLLSRTDVLGSLHG